MFFSSASFIVITLLVLPRDSPKCSGYDNDFILIGGLLLSWPPVTDQSGGDESATSVVQLAIIDLKSPYLLVDSQHLI